MTTIKLSPLLSIILVGVILQLMSCGGKDPELSPQEKVKVLLQGTSSSSAPSTWKIKTESVDGVDKTSLYTGFTITFTSTTFTTSNGEPIWPASGTWSFKGESTTTIVRNDGTEVEIDVTDTSLVMTIQWTHTTLGSGRTYSVAGKNVFTLEK